MIIREKVSRWRLIDYFDVWGNEEDGYWVNNQTEVLDDIMMTADVTNEEIFNFLKDAVGYFGPDAKFENMNFDGDDEYIEICSEQEWGKYPLCRLERIR